jgi:hypothetical protein
VEAERFVLKDQAGRMRGEIITGSSGSPSLEFFDEKGKATTRFLNRGLMFFSGTGTKMTEISDRGLSISREEGDIELGTIGLRLKVISSAKDGLGWLSLGMMPSDLSRHKGAIGPDLRLAGNNGEGYVELNTADGPGLHFEPGMSETGTVRPGGFVDISSSGPLIQIADQQGLTAGIGRFELKNTQTGHIVKMPTASIVLTGKDGVLWSAP